MRRQAHRQAEQQTVGEYALHHLFNSFVGQADDKIEQCVGQSYQPEQLIDEICGVGADPKFDQLISALGHIARQKPKPLIDTLMLWRRNKSDTATKARSDANQGARNDAAANGLAPRRNAGHLHVVSDPVSVNINPAEVNPQTAAASRYDLVTQAERRATASIYLLCRVLNEIMRQTTLECLTVEMAERLEDIIFCQLKAGEIESLLQSPFRMANWKIFGELLGVMMDIHSRRVADSFFDEIQQLQKDYLGRGIPNKEGVESKMEVLIMGMRTFRIRTYPEESFARGRDFLHRLGKSFASSHGQRTKYAYCRILERLLLPVAGHGRAELNTPQWQAVVEKINTKVSEMILKPKHWLEAFPLMVALCCVSPQESLAAHWMPIAMTMGPKLKDRLTRPTALQALARLVWAYVYRLSEPAAVAVKKLEEVIKMVLSSAKKYAWSTESNTAEPLIQFIRAIGYRYQDLCFKNLILPFLNAELFAAGRELRVDQLEPEKMVIGIRAFLAILTDLEQGPSGSPPFPQDFRHGPLPDRLTTGLQLAPLLLAEPIAVTARKELPTWPVSAATLADPIRKYYDMFCGILGKITLICDETFGGQAVLDEKFSNLTPKTPIAETFSFSRKEDHQTTSDYRRGFYDLFHVAVQALPRCLSKDIPINSLVNLLCTGTAHVRSNIAISSAESLRSIAHQSLAQQVTMGFARFILKFDDRYSTMSDGGLLGPGHIENTLQLYVELLRIWIGEITRKVKPVPEDGVDNQGAGTRAAQLDLSAVWAHVDEIESHGLFFLCSQSRRVRSFSILVLRLITGFDAALGKNGVRIISVLERDAAAILDFDDESLSVAERSRLQRGMRKSHSRNALIELCGSEVSYDSTLWFKIFPNLVRIVFDRSPNATTLTREIVCARLLQMHKPIVGLTETPKGSLHPSVDLPTSRITPRISTSADIMIEQWKLYLIFACTTLTNTGAPQASSLQDFQHARKQSRPSPQGLEKINSARSLFQLVIPHLDVGANSVRDAVVTALGSINVNLYNTLLESLQSVVAMCDHEMPPHFHQRTISSPRRNRKTDRLRTEITHIYKLTSHFLREEAVYSDDTILSNLVSYTNTLKIFLSKAEVQHDWDFQKLRKHYCGLVEEVFEGVNRRHDILRWMPFESRKSAFILMEGWCGYSPNTQPPRSRDENVLHSATEQQREVGDKLTAAMEIEKRNLRVAALSAMAALCVSLPCGLSSRYIGANYQQGGPVSLVTEANSSIHFDKRRILSWIETTFSTPSDKLHAIGRRALKNLILHNRDHPVFLEHAIQMCYVSKSSKAFESYFAVVSDILLEYDNYPLEFWKILGAAVFTLGHDSSQLRLRSAQLLRTLEERLQRSSKIQDYYIGISDKTTAVYKLAQFEISRRLAKSHSDLAFKIFSEFTLYFRDFDHSKQRNMVAAILPWVQTIGLNLDPNGGPTASSYMLLANLFEITISSSAVLHNEVQALWQALATGPYGGNVQLVLDFIISLCLERREQNFVDYAKQIVVFLSSTPAGQKVVEFLLLQITPKSMVQEIKEPAPPPADIMEFPYTTDLATVLPVGNKQASFALGQLALILLVDLMVSPVQLAQDTVPLLLQIVFVLWDHYTPLVQDQAREMLVHLIHELVLAKIDDQSTQSSKKAVEDVIDAVRRHDSSIVWAYDDGANPGQMSEDRVPHAMDHLTKGVVAVFALAYPGIQEHWGKTTLNWATSCPVRHVACRSFQVFRCILTSLDQSMLADMLARLSNTIADDESDIQTFSMEILTTLKTTIRALSPEDLSQYPQLFWSTCACLNTIHESEFLESLAMLESFMDKVDLSEPRNVQILAESMPAKWEGSFEGVQNMIYQGLRSSLSVGRTLALLDKLTPLPNNFLIGDDSRLLFTLLASLPGMLQATEQKLEDSETFTRAGRLAKIAEMQGLNSIASMLQAYAQHRYSTVKQLSRESMTAIRETYLPAWDFRCLVFFMGMLTNQLGWFKLQTMKLLCVIIPHIDMHKPEIAQHGSDLISPLLRLLQTEFCPQALEVLDHIMTMPRTAMDRDHIRMSMAGWQSRAMRKEYERTQSLFGIPDESGWSIPMPAIHSTMTRSNVHAVFYTCAGKEANKISNVPTDQDIEFRPEDLRYRFRLADRTATMISDDVRADGNMGDLVMQLNSLDEIFDDNLVSTATANSRTSSLLRYSIEPAAADAGARYDEQTLPLLRKSLTRTASVSSLHNGFTDARGVVAREGGFMSPTAFVASTPAAFHTSTGVEYLSDGDGDDYDEAFSDEDTRAALQRITAETTSSFGSRVRRGTKAGMRRLTGGSLRGRERNSDHTMFDKRWKPQQGRSPKVPKIPSSYLQHPGATLNGADGLQN
ncbi:MAG: Cell morphogenesis protein PAG1 [Phylliscum demangeonii]|nr:MAG: Cell morphogenesis protein PAG1 [Phylliscum demangeonii]